MEQTFFLPETHFEVLGLEASSPWPRSLRSSKIALSSARGQHYFLNHWNFVGKRQKTRGKFVNTFFVFRNWGIGLAQRASPQLKFHQLKKFKKSLLFFQFLFSVFRVHQKLTTILKARGPGTPSNQYLPANLNVNLEEMDSFRPKSCYLMLTSSLFMNVMHSGADLCWALGEIICNFTPILPYFQHWGGWTSTTILCRFGNLVNIKKKCKRNTFSPNSGEDQKKKVFIKNWTLFSQI